MRAHRGKTAAGAIATWTVEDERSGDLARRCAELAATRPDWLDSLVDALPVASDGHFEDDWSLVLMTFPAEAAMR